MAGWREIANVWKNVREVDLRPIREDAIRDLRLALVGEEGSGRRALAEQLRQDPARPGARTHTPVLILGPERQPALDQADLVVIVVEAGRERFEREQALAQQLTGAGKKVVVFFNQKEGDQAAAPPYLEAAWDAQRLFIGRVDDPVYLSNVFAPAILELMPDDLLPLGRQFPLFRSHIARHLINEAAFANAAYSLSAGLAEIVPVLGIPLNLADMVVLTKAQAFLVYRLGLALGYTTRWQDYLSEFGGVVGGGFVWRQLARYLVGLVPVWGILPKTAVAYAGTYAVGHTILRWYLTGRRITPQQVRELYRQALVQGRNVARNLLARAPRPRLSRAPRPRLGRRRPASLPAPADPGLACPDCGRLNAADARFCQYCGRKLPGPGEEAA